MYIKNKYVISGSSRRRILIDTTIFSRNNERKKIIIFCHGFKGFKDWGAFNKIAENFAKHGFVFVKFNFSHNGTTIKNPNDFVDLAAFGENNFSIELNDLDLVISWVLNNFSNSTISLFGHSRGGAISIIKSSEDNRIANIISWASPSDLMSNLPSGEKAKKWKKSNVVYVYNGRTKQNMPLYYQFFQDCITNIKRFNLKAAVSKLIIPHLHIHGDADTTVLVDHAYNFKKWNCQTNLHIINDADHVFSATHPFKSKYLSKDLKEAIDVTVNFLEC